MPKRSSKRKDVNVVAAQNVEKATKGKPATMPATLHTKNPAAVELGRLGGLKGGKARAEKLSSERRVEIAKRAARVRWGK